VPVLDASVLVEYLAGGEHRAEAREQVLRAGAWGWVPHLVDAEVGHVLRRGVLAGELSGDRADAALEDLANMPLRRVGHRSLLRRAWELHPNVTFYDGLYVALAERLGRPLVTLDARLARAPGVDARVEVIGQPVA
jgi:predicted nucleic acid-binding protein